MLSHFIVPTQGRLFELGRLLELHAPWVILFQEPESVDEETTLDNLVESNFSGYERIHPSWTTPSDPGNGDAASLSAPFAFSHDGGGTANDVRGMGIVEDDGGFGNRLLRVYLFPSVISMATLGDTIARQIRLLHGQYPLA